jgi:hypothetical protein
MRIFRSGWFGSTAARPVVAVAFALVASMSAPVGPVGPVGMQGADAAGPSGPDTCLWGYVWREARPSDHVCVTPATRSQTWTDNALAPSRRSPTGGTWGPDTCLAGYVWRDAYPGDHVCVPPATRTQAAADNVLAPTLRAMDPFDHGGGGFPFPYDCVSGGIDTLALSPDGSFSFGGDLGNNDLLPNGVCRPGRQATVLCAVALLDGAALWFSHSVWLPSRKVSGAPLHKWTTTGTSAAIAENWTRIRRQGYWANGTFYTWRDGTSVCGLADTRTVADITAAIRDHLHITGPLVTVVAS